MISNVISFSWNPIDCVEQNGLINEYVAEFRPVGHILFSGLIIGKTFTARELIPSTNYSFRVAGVSIAGQGPFSDILYAFTAGIFCYCYTHIIYMLYKLDLLPPILTVTTSTTSVNISWTQPDDSFPVLEYELSLSRVTGERQLLCDSRVDDRSVITTSNTSMEFIGLHEFSNYTIMITAVVVNETVTVTANFITLSSGK